jgi:hypothetical protein
LYSMTRYGACWLSPSSSKYDGLETKQMSLTYEFMFICARSW